MEFPVKISLTISAFFLSFTELETTLLSIIRKQILLLQIKLVNSNIDKIKNKFSPLKKVFKTRMFQMSKRNVFSCCSAAKVGF